MDNAQLAAENAGKAVLLLFGVSPKTHDPAGQIARLLETETPSIHLRPALAEIVPDLLTLGSSQHMMTDYGDEATLTLPWDLFTRESAAQALPVAERVCERVRQILAGTGMERDVPDPGTR